MLDWAEKERGITRVATGHYARLRPDAAGGRTQLLRGLDARKDQSYFLYDLPQAVLQRLIFPLGSSPSPTPAPKRRGWVCAPPKNQKAKTFAWLTITAR